MPENCRDCVHCSRVAESWELAIYSYECAALPGRANLRSFPFQQTECGQFEKRSRRLEKTLSEALYDA